MGRQSGAFRTLLTHFSQRYPKIPIMDPSFAASTCIASDLMRINLAGAPARDAKYFIRLFQHLRGSGIGVTRCCLLHGAT